MKKQLAILILALFASSSSFAQKFITSNRLNKIFKESIKQPSKKHVAIGSNAWTFCNSDSSFFTNDTIQMYSGNYSIVSQSRIKFTCCQKFEWTFYKRNKFVQSKSQTCQEPSSSTPVKTEDWFSLDIIAINDEIYLEASNKTVEQKFKVQSIWNDPDNNKYKVLTLVRIKK
jgi:hypothetical protein